MIVYNMFMCMPCCVLFSCNRTKNRLYLKSHQKLQKEASIESLIKKLRVLKAAAKASLTRAEWVELKETHAIRRVWYDDLSPGQRPKGYAKEIEEASVSTSVSP